MPNTSPATADTTSDALLVESTLAGQVNAYAELVRKYETKVRSYCKHMLNNHHTAEDAAQEVFIKAYKNLSSFRYESSFLTWLYRIASNHCIDIARKERFSRFLSLEFFNKTTDSKILADFNDTNSKSNIESDVASKYLLNSILNALSPEYRSLILLREAYGLSYEELAETLNCSVDSVKAKLQRTRKKVLSIKSAIESSEYQKEHIS